MVALVGPSGAGKTSLLRLLNGGLSADSGSVQVEGEKLSRLTGSNLRRLRARIGFIHQDHALVPVLRVSQNVIAGRLGARGLFSGLRSVTWPKRQDLERAYELLERVGVPHKLFDRTDTLSGGQQQRVAVARALFQDPHALLADEPVASVDPARGRAIIELLVGLARERNLTLVASLHDIDLARAFFPRTVGLRSGRIVYDGPTSEITGQGLQELYQLEGDG